MTRPQLSLLFSDQQVQGGHSRTCCEGECYEVAQQRHNSHTPAQSTAHTLLSGDS